MNVQVEEWRDVPGFPGFKVSSFGRVTGQRVEVLKPSSDKDGYTRVSLNKKYVKIHRLVALAFLPNPLNKPTINHINGDKADNRVENLEWHTRQEQARHRCSVLGKSPTGEWNRKPIALVKDDQVFYFESAVQTDQLLGLYQGCIQDCKRNSGTFQGFRIQNM
jgi:hypothetical protein